MRQDRRITLRLPAELSDKLEEMSDNSGMVLSAYVRQILEEHVAEEVAPKLASTKAESPSREVVPKVESARAFKDFSKAAQSKGLSRVNK
jgi:predicted DNA-binding protein